MSTFIPQLLTTLEIIAPIFIIIFLGKLLYQIGLLDQQFVTTSSQLVFKITLPVLLFTHFVTSKMEDLPYYSVFAIIYIGITILFLVSWLIGKLVAHSKKDVGVIVHGSFRSNFGVIGLAVLDKLLGSEGLTYGALILAMITPIYNALGVIAVTFASNAHLHPLRILKQILLNPLIIACYAAIPCMYFSFKLPEFALDTGHYLSSLTLPLALLGIGASLRYPLRELCSRDALIAVTFKLILAPLVGLALAFSWDLSDSWRMSLFILFACPSAVVTFSFADAMTANSALAGKIIVMSTIFSLLTLSLGITWLQFVRI